VSGRSALALEDAAATKTLRSAGCALQSENRRGAAQAAVAGPAGARSVDPLRYVAHARPGCLLRRWYDAPHALDRAAYRDAFARLTRKLSIDGR